MHIRDCPVRFTSPSYSSSYTIFEVALGFVAIYTPTPDAPCIYKPPRVTTLIEDEAITTPSVESMVIPLVADTPTEHVAPLYEYFNPSGVCIKPSYTAGRVFTVDQAASVHELLDATLVNADRLVGGGGKPLSPHSVYTYVLYTNTSTIVDNWIEMIDTVLMSGV